MPQRYSLPDQAKVVYEYEVDGNQLTGNTLQLQGNMQTTHTVQHERELLSRFPEGKSVLVYYAPANPEEAVLQPGVPKGLIPTTAFGAVMLLVGSAIILFFTGAVGFPPSPLATGVFFLVPGPAISLFAFWYFWMVVASYTWPTTEAEVTRSEVVEGAESSRFKPGVAYQYEVDGITYTASGVDWGALDMARADAQRIVEQYPVGTAVTIHYHPTAPYRAVIEPRGGWRVYCPLSLLGVVFTIAGIMIILNSGAH
jgi:hypothetical protein